MNPDRAIQLQQKILDQILIPNLNPPTINKGILDGERLADLCKAIRSALDEAYKEGFADA